MQNKALKICTLGVLSVLGLCACDEIVAKPSDYNSEIVTVDGFNQTIYNDIMSVIYDQIHDGGIGGDVLQEILFEYATSVVGKYNIAVKDARDSAKQAKDEITLKKANHGITVTGLGTKTFLANADAQKFIDDHKAYWSIDPATGKRDTSDSGKQLEYARVKAKWATIEERIAEKMYNDYTSGSYADRSLYSEWMYLRNLDSSLYSVQSPYVGFPEDKKGYSTFISPDVEPSQVFTANILTRSYYQTTASYDADEAPVGATLNTYVEDQLIPDIYRQLLVEQYLYDNSYNTLGGSYARKVNIIKIADNANYTKAAKSLMEYEVSLINAQPAGTTLDVDSKNNNFEEEGLAAFKDISKIWTGVDLTTEQEAVLTLLSKQNGFTSKTVKGESYWGGTEYGKVMDDFAKIKIDDKLNESTIESDFTASGTYTVETGKEIKRLQTKGNDHTTNGWFIKNGGLSDLPESIRTRLFSVGVSNALDLKNPEQYDRYSYESSSWKYDKDNDYNSYVARINGRFYLKNDKVLAEDNEEGYKDVLFYDTSSSTYYIVQVLEAVTTSKLSKTSTKSYSQIRGIDKMTEIINDILKVVGTGESYATTSTKYWLEKAGISYHDQAVYDYFKSNYPDLFD